MYPFSVSYSFEMVRSASSALSVSSPHNSALSLTSECNLIPDSAMDQTTVIHALHVSDGYVSYIHVFFFHTKLVCFMCMDALLRRDTIQKRNGIISLAAPGKCQLTTAECGNHTMHLPLPSSNRLPPIT